MTRASVRRVVEHAMRDAAFRQLLESQPEQALADFDLSEEEHAMLSDPHSRRMLAIALETMPPEVSEISRADADETSKSPTGPRHDTTTDRSPLSGDDSEQAAITGKLPTTDDATFTVGAPYVGGHVNWPEMAQYTYRGGRHELVLFIRGLTADDLQHLLSDDPEFALCVEGDVLVLLCCIGDDLPWQAACCSWHYVPENRRILPESELSDESSPQLTVELIDANNGIVRGARSVRLPAKFARTLHAAIRQQAQSAWCGERKYRRQVDALKKKHPDPVSLLPNAIARTKAPAA